MDINATKNFYKGDKKQYIIKNNKDFISYIYDIVHRGYKPIASLDDYQNLINNIVNWYEIKYPNVQLINKNNDIKYRIDKYMNIDRLIYGLSKKESNILKCYYRGMGSATKNIYDNNGIKIGYEPILYLQINKRGSGNVNNNFLINANCITGVIHYCDELAKIINSNEVNLDQLYDILKNNYNNRLEFDELKKCIYNHNCDETLRKILLELASLKMIYSLNTTPEIGYERAKKFISEFNDKFKLNLNSKYIDSIMGTDYSKDLFIRYIDNFKNKTNSKLKNLL